MIETNTFLLSLGFPLSLGPPGGPAVSILALKMMLRKSGVVSPTSTFWGGSHNMDHHASCKCKRVTLPIFIFLFLTAVIFTAGKLFTLAEFTRARCLNDYHDGRNS